MNPIFFGLILSSAAHPVAATTTPASSPVAIGYCTTEIQKAKSAGFDYAEVGVARIANMSADEYDKFVDLHKSTGIPTPVGNGLLPSDLKIVGPVIDKDKQMDFVRRGFARVQKLGLKMIVFGSGSARQAPTGFSQDEAVKQLVEFAKRIAPEAQKYGIVLAVEPLRHEETNMINTVAEALKWVEAVNHPNFQLMVDLYHLASEKEDPAILFKAAKHLKHVHIANPNGRGFPMTAGEYDYAGFFAILHKIGYEGRISVEAKTNNVDQEAPQTIALLRQAYAPPSKAARPSRRKK